MQGLFGENFQTSGLVSTERMFFSSLDRGTIILWPHPAHWTPTSLPRRHTVSRSEPQGCFFFITRVSPTENALSIFAVHDHNGLVVGDLDILLGEDLVDAGS